MITWSGQAVQLDATVEDFGEPPLTYAWSADPGEGVVFSDPEVEDPTVTITKPAPTDDATIIMLTLAVSDGVNPTAGGRGYSGILRGLCGRLCLGLRFCRRGFGG